MSDEILRNLAACLEYRSMSLRIRRPFRPRPRHVDHHKDLMNRLLWLLQMAIVLALWCAFSPSSMWAQQKLVFKDGSVERVETYAVKGDRVRFKSTDRNDWEEVPLNLVDLEATKKLNAKEAQELKKTVEPPVGQNEPHGGEKLMAGSSATGVVEITPGVPLPDAYGLYVWNGKSLQQLTEAGTRKRKDKRNIIINLIAPAPIMKQITSIQLDGPASDTRLRTTSPVFFAHLPDGRGGELALFRMMVTKSARVLKEVAHSQITGSDSEKSQKFIFTPSIRIAENVYKIFPTKPLSPGEYCLVELTPQQNNLQTTVWDFGIDDKK